MDNRTLQMVQVNRRLIARQRFLLGKTFTELARQSGVSIPTVRALEQGTKRVLPDNVRKIVTVLGLKMEDVLIDEPERQSA